MFAYYVDLAWRSLRRNPALTALMVLAIALGIGASMTTLTVLHVLSGDPIPEKSGQLYYPQVDPQDIKGTSPGTEPLEQVTLIDGLNLLHAKRAGRQALMSGGSVAVIPEQAMLAPFYVYARYTSADFFAMFDAPFLYGGGWAAADDDAHARDVVIAQALNDKLFGGANSVGRTLRMAGASWRIVGVLANWRPSPRFYDIYSGAYVEGEQVFLPLQAAVELRLGHTGSIACWGNGGGGDTGILLSDECAWLQFWVELDSPSKAAAYKDFLVRYSQNQKTLGRFQRAPNVRLRNVMQWLDYIKVVPDDVRLQTGLAVGFLLVCLINTMGLMLAKFMRRVGELGVRRALGASRREVFAQLLVEAGMVGLVGGVGGLLLAIIGLWLVRQRPMTYATLAHLDLSMLCSTFLLSVCTALLAGLVPAWRACQVAPALQLKSN